MAKQNLIPINSGVYVITNTANGKIYVGSSRHVRQRIRHHRRNLELGVHSSKRMIDDFLLFGWEVFEHEIVEPIHEPGVDLMAAEQRWIEKLRPYDPTIGYNLHPDAGGPRGYARPPETRERMRQAALARPPEHNEKISQKLTGREVAAETGEAISAGRRASVKAKAAIEAHNADKRVLSDDDVRRIRSLAEDGEKRVDIAAEFGVSRRVIRAILSGETYREVI